MSMKDKARVVKQADTADLKSAALQRAGSIPASGTTPIRIPDACAFPTCGCYAQCIRSKAIVTWGEIGTNGAKVATPCLCKNNVCTFPECSCGVSLPPDRFASCLRHEYKDLKKG